MADVYPRAVPAPVPNIDRIWSLREVAKGLFVGGFYSVVHSGWGCVIDLCCEFKNDPEYEKYWSVHWPVHDGEPMDPELLSDIAAMADRRHATGMPVLIHCAEGVSRSVAAAYYVLRREGYPHELALNCVRHPSRTALPEPMASAIKAYNDWSRHGR